MVKRCLFGPVTSRYAETNLGGVRAGMGCLTFNDQGDGDLELRPGDRWDQFASRFPQEWRPDFIALYLPYTHIPEWLWSAPVPIVGLAADWNLLWHYYRHCLPRCDLVLTDAAGVDACQRQGIHQARRALLYGCGQAWLAEPLPDRPRDIDILFVGNFSPAVQRDRLPWLARLASLADRYRVVLRAGVFGAEYRELLGRARIAFNRSIRGEANLRTFEAAAAGALLFQEAGNRETPLYFTDAQDCVHYTERNLEERLMYYLEHEEERRSRAAAAQAKVQRLGFAEVWQTIIAEIIEPEWDLLLERVRTRIAKPHPPCLAQRTWQLLSGPGGAAAAMIPDLAAALVDRPREAALHHALGLAHAVLGQRDERLPVESLEQVTSYFERALQADPSHLLAGLDRTECLAALGRGPEAIDQARQTLTWLDRLSRLGPDVLDGGHFPPRFDHFRAEWERAAWSHAGDPDQEALAKRVLIRWRLHFLLAELTGELSHYHEAALARPDLPVSRAMLGCALARSGKLPEARAHLQQALAGNPFDNGAARALHLVLGELQDPAGQRQLARDRWRLHQAAGELVPAEPWFHNAPPAGDELASILVLCCNQVEYSRLCLESVLRHTRPPFELIVVDNGSTDGTPEYLAAIAQAAQPDRVVVLRNENNVGYPAGCNQALAQARGRFIVFLNNDTIVTPHWLNSLIRCALHDWPQVGMVGAVTNYSRPPQQIAVDYTHLTDLAGFAERRRREHAGQALAVERLTGFCLLANRAVLQKIGGYDEQFGLGFFDDDDLSVRALQAGYRLAVALDVFIHHFGSRTFQGLGIDTTHQLASNFEKFKMKWGPEQTAGYQQPEPGANHQASRAEDDVAEAVARALVQPMAAGRPKVSLCMIVKNEEANLRDCLAPVADLFDEIVVVDTGSTDQTKSIAQELGARLVDFPWVDSFAAARNESLRHATGDWVFWLDADDRVDPANREKLRLLLADLPRAEIVGYTMKCACLPDPLQQTVTVVDHVRLFPNRPEIRWQYRVHEQILPALRRLGGQVRWADVVIQHTGYVDPALRGRKLERDLRLLLLENQENPDDPFTLFNLGSVYQEQGRLAEAIPLLRRSLERSHPADSIVRKLYALIAGCQRQLGQTAQAVATCQEGRGHYPDDTELLFLESQLRREQHDLAGAEACLVRLLERRERAHFASVDAGLAGYKARHNLAVLYQEQGRLAEAEAQWRAAVADNPRFLPAYLGSADLALLQRQWEQVDVLASQLESQAMPVEAVALRARGLLAHREFTAAQELLIPAVAQHPQAVLPLRLLGHAYLQEGLDQAAAERALRRLLELAPEDPEARNNLAVLTRQPPAEPSTLEELYQQACTAPSDIHEHCPTLLSLGRACRHITELGTRTGVSTVAWLHAQPDKLICYDLVRWPQVDRLRALAGRTEFVFHQADVLKVEIEPTDLLFIDTWHVYEQLREELRLHAGQAKRYIVLHDTETFGHTGETSGHRGLWPAVEEFLAQGTFQLMQRYRHNHGLTVLERKSALPTVAIDGRQPKETRATPPD